MDWHGKAPSESDLATAVVELGGAEVMEANRIAYGKALAELGKANDKVVVLDADLGKATNTIKFKDVAPRSIS